MVNDIYKPCVYEVKSSMNKGKIERLLELEFDASFGFSAKILLKLLLELTWSFRVL